MSLETGLNFELLHKTTAVSKRHCTGYLFLEFFCLKGKYVSYDAKWLVFPFSANFLIFIIKMISYTDDEDKVGSEFKIFFDHIR